MVRKSLLVAYPASQMFDLVDQCEYYPRFLPWCSRVDLQHRDAKYTRATLHVNYRGVKTQFSTENLKKYPSLMQLSLIEGPFKRLEGEWRFIALNEEACKVELEMDYEFSGKLLGKVLGPVFNHISNSFVGAFTLRANQIYGGDAGA